MRYPKGIGLPGRTWAEGGAIWMEDIDQEEDFCRQEFLGNPGVRAAVAFPIRLKQKVLGVIVFHARHLPASDSLISLFDAVGSQIGQFIVTKQAEFALRESEVKYKSLYDQIPVGVYRSTREGKIIHANPAFAAMLGYVSVEEMIEKCQAPSVYIDPTDRTRKLERLAASKDIFSQELHWKTRDGRKIWVMDTVQAIFDPSGRVEYLDGTIEEITDRKKAEQTLRESEQKYRSLFIDAQRQARELALQNQIRSVLARELDLQTIFHTVVEAVSSIYGYTLVSLYLIQGDQLILQHQVGYEYVFHKIPITYGVVGRVARTGHPVLIQDVNAEEDFIEAVPGTNSEVCVPLMDNGRVVGILNAERTQNTVLNETDLRMMIALAEHISIAIERARLFTTARENESKFRNIVENSVDGITLTDENGLVVEWNRGQENISGLSRDEVLGRPVWDVYYQIICDEEKTPHMAADIQKATQDFLETGKPLQREATQEFTLQRPNGERCTIQNVMSRIKGKDGFMMSSFSRDITERARLEQMKSDFINRAAHDLRTPLTTVTMMVDLIQEGGEEEEIKKYWQVLNAELKRQQGLIEELLTLGRIESGRFNVQAKPLDLPPILDDSLQATLPLAVNKQIDLSYEISPDIPKINANEANLQQVFVNLLNNAIKFTPCGGKVALNAAPQGNGVLISVGDNGMGIPEEDVPQLFTRFFRAANAIYNEVPGSGVGLYIVKSIVELLGGSIHVQSKIDFGTTFEIWLPALKY